LTGQNYLYPPKINSWLRPWSAVPSSVLERWYGATAWGQQRAGSLQLKAIKWKHVWLPGQRLIVSMRRTTRQHLWGAARSYRGPRRCDGWVANSATASRFYDRPGRPIKHPVYCCSVSVLYIHTRSFVSDRRWRRSFHLGGM